MFVVAAKRCSTSEEGGLETFIGRQIDAAKAPARAHVLVRSGTDATLLKQTALAENKAGSMDVGCYHTNPLIIPAKQSSNAYLSTIHFPPDSSREPELKRSYQSNPTASLRIYTPNYSTSTLDIRSEKTHKQASNSALQPVLPKSAKRWAIQRNGEGKRDPDSTRLGLNVPAGTSALELKTKEELLLYLNDVEQRLKSALDDCLPALMESTPNVN
ncbi:hypothetical protein GL50803_0015137 [Giardia duodenalis]|uniref:Uncharacterized protein n=1 Tax=Giardia intestinalis (strain ATCC 50803 / WB clone C6) TaxID=184922 RepID=A8B3P3_GIAIC|nr:hypothetical protein GL50803_0015137 [Giardia intestinalis]KAE8303207.1 hypothetical protein GL50803_0015137 [Giardia intestinalis]|eukprot:XP_001710274.1 Hypothetical protein GL50803_15137 [Giardia lamblia ATCC 50803]